MASDTPTDYVKKFWAFLNDDSWSSFVVTLVLAFIVIKFIFFPTLSFFTGTALPLVIVESCSMYHEESGFEQTFGSEIYEDFGILLGDTGNWIFQNGFSKGDVIFVVGPKNLEVGDVIIFNGGQNHPLIHRLISVDDKFTTKGDNYKTNEGLLSAEKDIPEERIIGKALFKVPFIGWAKLIFFESSRDPKSRGLCK
jgi:signal peptidase I